VQSAIRKISVGVALALLLTIQAQPAQSGMSIAGVVLREGTDAPVAGTEVRLERIASASGGTQFRRTSTEPDGRFAFTNLQPASYRVTGGSETHAQQEYGSPLPGPAGERRGTVLTLAEGESRRDIVIRLIQPAVISGRILAPDGTPLVGMTVDLLRYRYNERGRKSLVRESIPGVFTDDRGVYRMTGVPPGRYYRRAGAGLLNAINSPRQRSPGTYTTSFYPGVADESRATLVDVRSGDEIRNIDFVLARVQEPQTFRIRGRIIDAETQGPPVERFSGALVIGDGWSGGEVKADGTFDVGGVPPGSQPVWAMLPGVPFLSRYRVATGTVNVIASDVDNVELVLVRNLSVRGRITVDGEIPGIENIALQLTGRAGGVNLGPTLSGKISPDGTVEFENASPIEYQLAIRDLPPNVYVKDVTYGDVDVLLNPFPVSVRGSGSLEIVLSDKAGQMEGVVRNAAGQAAPGMQAVLVPSDSRERADRYKAAITDAAGRFAFSNVRPGDYKLFAWEAIEPFSYLDPDVLQRYESEGTPVRVDDKEKTFTDLKVIPRRER
jgi:hypothetical protein